MKTQSILSAKAIRRRGIDVGSPVRFARRPVPRILQRDDERRETLMLLPLSLPARGTFRPVMGTVAGGLRTTASRVMA